MIRSQYWVETYKLTFFSYLVEKNSLIVEKFLSVAKMASTVYETENLVASVCINRPDSNFQQTPTLWRLRNELIFSIDQWISVFFHCVYRFVIVLKQVNSFDCSCSSPDEPCGLSFAAAHIKFCARIRKKIKLRGTFCCLLNQFSFFFFFFITLTETYHVR